MAGAILAALLAFLSLPPDPPQDRAVPHALPASGALRLTVMGTSLTANYDWPERLVAALSGCLGREVTLARVARPGSNVTWGLGQIAEVTATAPDILLIEFAINDADLRDGLSLQSAAEAHRRLIADLQTELPETAIVLLTMSPAQGLRGLLRPWLGWHYAATRDLARTADLGLVDLYPRWLARPRAARGLDADGLHPDTEVAAGVILPPLLTALAKTIGHECHGSAVVKADAG